MASVEVGATHVTVTADGGQVRVAKILERVGHGKWPDRGGSVLLDRIVHGPHERFAYWSAAGAYVTELSYQGGREQALPLDPDADTCTCTRGCDCQDDDDGKCSNECPIHNDRPAPHPECRADRHWFELEDE